MLPVVRRLYSGSDMSIVTMFCHSFLNSICLMFKTCSFTNATVVVIKTTIQQQQTNQNRACSNSHECVEDTFKVIIENKVSVKLVI